MSEILTTAEQRQYDTVCAKDRALRAFMDCNRPCAEPAGLLTYLTALKNTLGNLNNDVSFVASLLVKPFLKSRFGIEFDAALKPQGAAGVDVECTLPDGTLIVGEIQDHEAVPAELRRKPEEGNPQRPAAARQLSGSVPVHVRNGPG